MTGRPLRPNGTDRRCRSTFGFVAPFPLPSLIRQGATGRNCRRRARAGTIVPPLPDGGSCGRRVLATGTRGWTTFCAFVVHSKASRLCEEPPGPRVRIAGSGARGQTPVPRGCRRRRFGGQKSSFAPRSVRGRWPRFGKTVFGKKPRPPSSRPYAMGAGSRRSAAFQRLGEDERSRLFGDASSNVPG
jgi:hypothetical protein